MSASDPGAAGRAAAHPRGEAQAEVPALAPDVKQAAPVPPLWLRARRGETGDAGATLRIGVLSPSYGLEKVSYALAPAGVRYTKLSTLPLHRVFRPDTRRTACPFVIGPRQDLIHSFNHLPRNGRFVVSFESELPRFLHGPSEADLRAGFSLLASPRCRGILALSEAAAASARLRLDALGVAGTMPQVARKMQVFRGGIAVPDALAAPHPDKSSGPIEALFVGGSAFHKGIEATLGASRLLRAAGIDLRLTVVARPELQTFVAPRRHDPAGLIAALEAEPWITRHGGLQNRAVLDLMHRAHLLFFPSLDESLGWVAVEAGLCGAARAVSNVFALPELVRDGQDGWLAPLPLRPDRRWAHLGTAAGAERWDATQKGMGEALATRILASGARPAQLIELGEAARTRMRQLYDADAAAETLRAIYDRAVAAA